MQKFHEGRQVCLREIFRTHPRIEAFEPEINGIGPIFDGCFGTFPISRRREQLRAP
jgi:hypothetical protein